MTTIVLAFLGLPLPLRQKTNVHTYIVTHTASCGAGVISNKKNAPISMLWCIDRRKTTSRSY